MHVEPSQGKISFNNDKIFPVTSLFRNGGGGGRGGVGGGLGVGVGVGSPWWNG